MFQYNQESAMKAGGTAPISGPYEGQIVSAIWGESELKKTKYLELSFEADNGVEFKFLKLYFQKADGTEVKGGASMINAIMGLTQVQNLSVRPIQGTNDSEAPELIKKRIGLVMQKRLYTKNDNSEGYAFEIKIPFMCGTKQTLKEALSNSQPQTVDLIVSNLQDIDDRNTQGATSQPSTFGQQPPQQQQGGFGAPQQSPQANQGSFSNPPSGGFGQPMQSYDDLGHDLP